MRTSSSSVVGKTTKRYRKRVIQSMTLVLCFVTLCKLLVQIELLRNYIYMTAVVTLQILISHLARDICV